MKGIDQRSAIWAAVAGAICWAFGATSTVFDELDYRGFVDSPIPYAAGFVVTAVGSVLLILAFMTIRRVHRDQGSEAGTPGYSIAMAGLVMMLFPTWPLIFLGPLVVALGVTIYASTTLSAGKTRSFGLWLHALNIPVGTAVGFAFDGGGYDGGIGVLTSLVMVLFGFMSLAYDAAAHEMALIPAPAADSAQVVA